MVPSVLNVLQSGRRQFRVRKEMRRLWVTWAVIVFCELSGEFDQSISIEIRFCQ